MQDARCMHVLVFLTQQVPKYGIRGQPVAQLRTLPIYTSRSYDLGFHNAFNVVSYLQQNMIAQLTYSQKTTDKECINKLPTFIAIEKYFF